MSTARCKRGYGCACSRSPSAPRSNRTLEQQFPSNPAVRGRIRGPDGKVEEDRPVLERIDAEESGLQKGFLCKELVLDLEWDRWGAPGPDRYALAWDASGHARLVSQ